MSVLSTLIEQHDAAVEARDSFAASLLDEKGEIRSARTDEESLRFAELDEVCVRLEERIAEVNESELRSAKVAEARKRVSAPAVVTSEARTYGPERPENSYFADMAAVAMGPGYGGYADAVERQAAHGREVIRDAVNDPEIRKTVVRKAKEHYRRDGLRARSIVADLERRAMDTTGTSGGSFVTPQYLVEDWAAYRQYLRPFADATNKNALPDYGMTIYLPQVKSPSAVASQATENSGVTESDPTAGYLSTALSTLAGQVVISQQLLDRAGPGIQFDRIVFDSLNRDYAQVFDAAVLSAVLTQTASSAANVVSSFALPTTGAGALGALTADVGKSSALMETTEGTILSPTHVFMSGVEFNSIGSWFDGFGRPYLANSPVNINIDGGDNVDPQQPETDTGFRLNGLPVIKDSNIPHNVATPSETQIIVAHMPEVWLWEGDLVSRTIPQTYAQNLSILLQVYSYSAVLVRYPNAVGTVSGAPYPATGLFLGK